MAGICTEKPRSTRVRAGTGKLVEHSAAAAHKRNRQPGDGRAQGGGSRVQKRLRGAGPAVPLGSERLARWGYDDRAPASGPGVAGGSGWRNGGDRREPSQADGGTAPAGGSAQRNSRTDQT